MLQPPSGAGRISWHLCQQMEKVLDNQYTELRLDNKHRPIEQKYTRKMFQLGRQGISWEAIKDDSVTFYLKVFSEAEVGETNRFYRSASGRKMVEQMPQLMREAMTLPQQSMQRLMPPILRISTEMAAELQALS